MVKLFWIIFNTFCQFLVNKNVFIIKQKLNYLTDAEWMFEAVDTL